MAHDVRSRRFFMETLAAAALAVRASPVAAQLKEPEPLGTGSAALTLTAGVHKVAANITLKADVQLMAGAQIDIAAGKTLTILGDFQAPVGHVFVGLGKVDMIRSRAPEARPEWWGAVSDDPNTDCLPALRACVAAHPVTQLGAGDYYISDTWKIDTSHRRIWGAGKHGHDVDQGTRIIVDSTDRDVVQVGYDHSPGGPNDFLQAIDMRWMEFARRRAAFAVNGNAVGAAGLRLRYVVHCNFEGLSSSEHAIGYGVTGAVRTFIRDCEAFFSASGPGFGPYYGFHFDGRTEIGLAGGNASIYVMDCVVAAGGPARMRPGIGAFLQGAFADTFLVNFETTAIQTGILVDGMVTRLSPDRRRSGHADLHIIMPIIDQFGKSGIELANLSNYAMIDLVAPYIAPARGAFAALHWHHGAGLTSITGGQLIGWVDADGGGNAFGVYGVQAEGLGISGTKVLGFRRPMAFDGCRDLDIVAAINNPDQIAGQGAIWLKDCERGYLRARVKGARNAFPQGVYCEGRGNRHLNIDITGIDPACLSGGAANRIQRDHAPVTENAGFDDNIVVGPRA